MNGCGAAVGHANARRQSCRDQVGRVAGWVDTRQTGSTPGMRPSIERGSVDRENMPQPDTPNAPWRRVSYEAGEIEVHALPGDQRAPVANFPCLVVVAPVRGMAPVSTERREMQARGLAEGSSTGAIASSQSPTLNRQTPTNEASVSRSLRRIGLDILTPNQNVRPHERPERLSRTAAILARSPQQNVHR